MKVATHANRNSSIELFCVWWIAVSYQYPDSRLGRWLWKSCWSLGIRHCFFAGYSSFLHHLQLPNHDWVAIWQHSDYYTHMTSLCGGNPAGMAYLFYYTEQNTKHKRGKHYKHQWFWIDTHRLPCWTSFTGRLLGKLRGCSWLFFGLAVSSQLFHSCCYELFNYFISC